MLSFMFVVKCCILVIVVAYVLNRNRKNTSPPISEETVVFALVRRFWNTSKLHERSRGHRGSQQNVLVKTDQANQAAAFGFLRGGFAAPSWALQFNTLHSSLAIASAVLLSPAVIWWRWQHECSGIVDGNLLCPGTWCFWMKRIVKFSDNTSEFCRCLLYCIGMYMIQTLFFILQNECCILVATRLASSFVTCFGLQGFFWCDFEMILQ